MTGPSNTTVDVMAILTDLQQQVSDLTGVLEAQQGTLRELTIIVQSQDHALRQLLPDSPLLSAAPAVSSMLSVLSVPAAAGRPGGA